MDKHGTFFRVFCTEEKKKPGSPPVCGQILGDLPVDRQTTMRFYCNNCWPKKKLIEYTFRNGVISKRVVPSDEPLNLVSSIMVLEKPHGNNDKGR